MNIHNLKRMYNHILTVPEELLNMSYWRQDDLLIEPECNTVGCVAGHCVFLDVSIIERFRNDQIDFTSWSEKFTELDFFDDAIVWSFLFDAAWGRKDKTNTKEQILARIKKTIMEGKKSIEFSWNLDFNYLVTNPNYLDQTPFKL